MKIILHNKNQGNTLLISIIATGLIGFLLSSYLGLVRTQHASVMRSQSWNSTMPIIEAGVEDAMTHLNTSQTNATLEFNGWQKIGNLYAIMRNIGPDYYIVTISNWFPAPSGANPVIESRGYVKAPTLITSTSRPFTAPTPLLAAANVSTPDGYVARGVRVTLARGNGLFTKAIISKGKITISGSVQTDSYASCDTNYSNIDGTYNPAKARDNGDVASNGTIQKVIDTSGSIEIYGRAHTGPGGTVGWSGTAAVGSKAWHQGGNKGIQPGYSRNDMNFDFRDAPPAPTGGLTPGSGNVGGTNYTYRLNGGHFRLNNDLTLSGSQKMIVTAPSTLYVVKGISMSGSSQLIVAPGASLQVWVGESASLSGQGVANQTKLPHNFLFYGLKTCTSISLSGGSEFAGIFYAPYAKMSFSGNSAYIGSAICAEANLSGTFDFHYDECLGNYGGKGFVVNSWNEMTPSEVRVRPNL